MRVDNRNVKNTIISIYFLLFVVAVLLATVFKSLHLIEGNFFYVFLGLILSVVVVHFIAKYFEYDSDGANLVITNQGLILAEILNYRENTLEIEKRKLIGYKLKNYIVYKSLVILTKNSDGSITKNRFNVSLLKSKKIKKVKQSLRKIIKENLKHKEG